MGATSISLANFPNVHQYICSIVTIFSAILCFLIQGISNQSAKVMFNSTNRTAQCTAPFGIFQTVCGLYSPEGQRYNTAIRTRVSSHTYHEEE